ncbi:hypothetical protein GCM10009551_020550 [Nocardiopsis tropica]
MSGAGPGGGEAAAHRYGMGLELGVSPIPPLQEPEACAGKGAAPQAGTQAPGRGRARRLRRGRSAGTTAGAGTAQTDEGERDGRQ